MNIDTPVNHFVVVVVVIFDLDVSRRAARGSTSNEGKACETFDVSNCGRNSIIFFPSPPNDMKLGYRFFVCYRNT